MSVSVCVCVCGDKSPRVISLICIYIACNKHHTLSPPPPPLLEHRKSTPTTVPSDIFGGSSLDPAPGPLESLCCDGDGSFARVPERRLLMRTCNVFRRTPNQPPPSFTPPRPNTPRNESVRGFLFSFFYFFHILEYDNSDGNPTGAAEFWIAPGTYANSGHGHSHPMKTPRHHHTTLLSLYK